MYNIFQPANPGQKLKLDENFQDHPTGFSLFPSTLRWLRQAFCSCPWYGPCPKLSSQQSWRPLFPAMRALLYLGYDTVDGTKSCTTWVQTKTLTVNYVAKTWFFGHPWCMILLNKVPMSGILVYQKEVALK